MTMATTYETNKLGNMLMSNLVHKFGDKVKLRTDLNDFIIRITIPKQKKAINK